MTTAPAIESSDLPAWLAYLPPRDRDRLEEQCVRMAALANDDRFTVHVAGCAAVAAQILMQPRKANRPT